MTDQKPTGVFVRLPLSNEQLGKLLAPTRPLNERLLAIGTPVARDELEVVCYSHEVGYTGPLVRQSDAQAQIAARDAEIGRDSERLDWLEKTSVNAEDLNIHCLMNTDGRTSFGVYGTGNYEETLRQAIDAARENNND